MSDYLVWFWLTTDSYVPLLNNLLLIFGKHLEYNCNYILHNHSILDL